MSVGLENLIIFDEEIVDKVQNDLKDAGANLMDKRLKWRRGEMEFEALMRLLDSQVRIIFFTYDMINYYLNTFGKK